MSSFGKLQSTRSARLRQSTLTPAPTPQPPPPPPPPAHDETATVLPPTETVHPALANNVRIQLTKGRGRAVHAASHTKPGQTLLALAPHAQALSTSSLHSTCASCLLGLHEIQTQRSSSHAGSSQEGGGEELLVCGVCKLLRYCSKTCQTTAWPSHKAECRGLSSLRAAYSKAKALSGGPKVKGEWIPHEGVRALARLAVERRRRREKNGGKDDLWWTQIASLHSHRSSLPALDPSTSRPSPYAQLAISLAIFLGHCFPPPTTAADSEGGDETRQADMREFGFEDVGEVMDLCCAFMSNSFTLASPSLAPLGVAIHPTAALFNHSCWPNAVVVFPEGGKGGMHIVALRAIEEGEEVVTSYIDISLPTSLRQQALERQYHFTCSCELCVPSPSLARLDVRERVVGRAAGVEEWVRQAMEVLLTDEKGLMTSLEQFDARNGRSIVRNLAQHFAPTAYPLFPLVRLLLTLVLSTLADHPERLADAVDLAVLVVGAVGAEGMYPSGHPVRGISLAELGKLLLVPTVPEDDASMKTACSIVPDELFGSTGGRPNVPSSPVGRLTMARDVLLRALVELRVGFGGEGGLVGREVGALVEGVEREVQGLVVSQRSGALGL